MKHSSYKIKKEMGNIYKYTSIEIALKILSNFDLKFSSPEEFKDKMDTNLNLLDYEFKKIHKDFLHDFNKLNSIYPNLETHLTGEKIKEMYKYSNLFKYNSLKITCFSKNGNSEYLWQEYGNKHDGVCFVFDEQLSSKFINKEIRFFGQGKVKYINQYKPIRFLEMGKIKSIEYWVFSKLEKFKHEQEYRIYYFSHEEESLQSSKFLLANFNSTALKAIKIGKLVEQENIEKILNILREKEIVFKEIKIKKNSNAKSQFLLSE